MERRIMKKQQQLEEIQQIVAKSVATHPAGRKLALIGGFRYRFLDGSVRTSNDIDYHWTGNLEEKRDELADLFRRVALPDIARRYGYAGRVDTGINPEIDSPFVKVVTLSFWKEDVSDSRLEIPVEVTRIACIDPIAVRTAGGTVYATASEGDMIESKVIALFNRASLQHRDILDLFLFRDHFLIDANRRLKQKFLTLGFAPADITLQMQELIRNRDYHAKAIQAVIDMQLATDSAAQLDDAGGGAMVFEEVMKILKKILK
jgi:hypothetical protein